MVICSFRDSDPGLRIKNNLADLYSPTNHKYFANVWLFLVCKDGSFLQLIEKHLLKRRFIENQMLDSLRHLKKIKDVSVQPKRLTFIDWKLPEFDEDFGAFLAERSMWWLYRISDIPSSWEITSMVGEGTFKDVKLLSEWMHMRWEWWIRGIGDHWGGSSCDFISSTLEDLSQYTFHGGWGEWDFLAFEVYELVELLMLLDVFLFFGCHVLICK